MKISLKDLVNLGLLDEECAKDICNLFGKSTQHSLETLDALLKEKLVYVSEELLQDTFAVSQGLRVVKTPEPTQEEIDMWKKVAGLVWSAGEFKGFPTSCDFVRTSEPTEQEIAEWHEEYAKFKDLDFKTIGKNVKILDQEQPYKYWQSDFCSQCGSFLSRYQYCNNCHIWQWQTDEMTNA